MQDIDVTIITDEGAADDVIFEHHHISDEAVAVESPKEAEVTTLVKMKFPNFAKLVATHSFEDVLEKNKGEDIILPADLLADLANADLVEDERKRQIILVLGGVVLGILVALVFVGGAA